MSEFDKWFKAEMPNSHKKVNKERIETVIYSCAEAAWDYQQAKINDSENTRAVLYRENIDIREKNADLQSKIDEIQKKYDAMHNAFIVADDCRKEWHESYMGVRKERDELQARVDGLKRDQNNLELKAEDAECASMSLDDQGVAKCDDDGKPYSLWGRVCQFKKTSNVTENDLERVYWEFDQERNNSGGERVVFKNTLRSLLNNLKGNKDD